MIFNELDEKNCLEKEISKLFNLIIKQFNLILDHIKRKNKDLLFINLRLGTRFKSRFNKL